VINLVIGGAASGKSEYAENLIMHMEGTRIYIATMEPFDKESDARIERHHKLRAGKGFETYECYRHLVALEIPEKSNVLLEDMTNLMAGERYGTDGGGIEAVIAGFDHLAEVSQNLTIVSGDLFSGGNNYEGDTIEYLKDLAQINRYMAGKADNVYEVVCGIPNIIKGQRII